MTMMFRRKQFIQHYCQNAGRLCIHEGSQGAKSKILMNGAAGVINLHKLPLSGKQACWKSCDGHGDLMPPWFTYYTRDPLITSTSRNHHKPMIATRLKTAPALVPWWLAFPALLKPIVSQLLWNDRCKWRRDSRLCLTSHAGSMQQGKIAIKERRKTQITFT